MSLRGKTLRASCFRIAAAAQIRDSLPAGLVILSCNTATGINSIIGYNTGILLQSGLSRSVGPLGLRHLHLLSTFRTTIIGMMLVDRKGRRFLFILGTSGIIVAMVSVGTLFLRTEKV